MRLFKDHVADYGSPWAAMKAISDRLGMTTETLRRWVREADVTLEQTAVAELAQQVRDLKRKVREREATVEVLQTATAFFTRAHNPIQR